MGRRYRLGKRQPAIERTRAAILLSARHLVTEGGASELSVGAVAREAGVSRVTVYNQFGSRALLMEALAQGTGMRFSPDPVADPRLALRDHLERSCQAWSVDPGLFRNLGRHRREPGTETERRLAERLAGADGLRPGCSIKEAEDVIGALTSFAVFDRMHKDGRRSPAAVAEILWRLASVILA